MNRNVRQGKLLTKLQEMSFFKKNILFIAICFVLLAFSTIGYSALNQKLFISGDLALRAVKDIRISDLKLVETLSGGYEQYNSKYTADTITITSALAEDGSATTYQATITNYGTTDMEIASISSNSTTWFADCTIIGLAKGDEISAGTSKTFKITLKRKANIATTDYVAATLVEFKFQEAKIRYLAYNIGGNSVQNGTPTPDNPVEIQSVGEKTKNLYDYYTETTRVGTKTSNGFKHNGGNNIMFYTVNALKNYVGQTATISFDLTTSETGDFLIYQYQENGIGIKFYTITQAMQANVKQRISITGPVAQLGTKEEYSKGEIIVYKNGFAGTYIVENIQFELGSVATEYEPYGYKIPVKVSGKNLVGELLSGYVDTSNFPEFTATSSNVYKSIIFNNIKAGTYTCSFEKPVRIVRSASTSSHNGHYGVAVSPTTVNITKATITLAHDEEIYILSFRDETSKSTEWGDAWVQCESGSEATDYEPYVEPITTNIYLDEPLRKIGDYADYINFENGKVVRNIKLVELNNDMNWTLNTAVANHFQVAVGDNYYNNDANLVMSNYYQAQKNGTSYYWNGDYAVISVDGSRIRFKNKDFTTLEEWKNWLSSLENPLYVIYRLATPTSQSVSLPEIIKKPYYTKYEVMSDVAPSAFTYDFVEK